MIIRIYILIITLNMNGLNAPNKRHWLYPLLNGYKNKTHIYVVYKRSTSDPGTQKD